MMFDAILILNTQAGIAAGTAASLLSLLLTVYVFLGIRKIRRHYLFTARVPDLSVRLNEIASEISSHMTAGSIESTALDESLADAEVALKSLLKKVNSALKPEVKSIIRKLDRAGGNTILIRFANYLDSTKFSWIVPARVAREQQVYQIYIDIYKLIKACDDHVADSSWEKMS